MYVKGESEDLTEQVFNIKGVTNNLPTIPLDNIETILTHLTKEYKLESKNSSNNLHIKFLKSMYKSLKKKSNLIYVFIFFTICVFGNNVHTAQHSLWADVD